MNAFCVGDHRAICGRSKKKKSMKYEDFVTVW